LDQEEIMRRTLNLKFIALVLACTIVASVGVHFLHAFQVKRNIGSLLAHATKAEEDGEPVKAIGYLSRYVAFRPGQAEPLLKLGVLLHENSKKSPSQADKQQARAYFVLNRGLMLDETNRDARRRVVDLAMALKRFEDAKLHLKALDKHAVKDEEKSRLKVLQGLCEEALRHYDEAAKHYEIAISNDGTILATYVRLANIYRYRLDNVKDANRVMDTMDKNNPKSFEAKLARAALIIGYARNDKKLLDTAKPYVKAAGELAPGNAQVVLVAGDLERSFAKADPDHHKEHVRDARAFFESGIKDHPNEPGMYLSLADLEASEGDVNRGLDILRNGLSTLANKGLVRNKRVDLLLQKGDLSAARKDIELMRKENVSEYLVRFQEARTKIADEEFGAGVALLASIRRDERVLESPALVRSIDFLLGMCFEKLGNPDQALRAYQECVRYDPRFVDARLKVAKTLLSLNRLNDALNEYTQVALFPDAPAAMSVELARLLLIQNLQLKPTDRNWNAVKERLAEAEKRKLDEVEVPILKADVMLLENPKNKKEARKLLLEAQEAKPDRAELWIALAALAGRDKKEDALKILHQAAKERPKLKDSVDLTLARLRFVAGAPDARKVLQATEDMLLAAKVADRPRLLAGLANAYILAGDNAAAARIWRLLAKDQPRNLGLRLRLFDLAHLAGNKEEALQWSKQIRELEGEKSGSHWRYAEAAQIYARHVRPEIKDDAPPLAAEAERQLFQARKYLGEAAKLRPTWFRVFALDGLIDDLAGRPETAIVKLQEALRLGDRRGIIVHRLVQLLFAKNRFEDVEKVIRVLIDQEQTLLSAGLGKLATESLLRTNDQEGALKYALDSVAKDSKNYKDHLWLGQILQQLPKHVRPDQNEIARAALERACELGAQHPAPWIALVRLLAKTEQKDASKVMDRAVKALPADEVPLTLAHCYAELGDRKLAEKHFLAAFNKKPTDVVIVENIASFYSHVGNQDKAQEFWERILTDSYKAEPPLLRRARRNLAVAKGLRLDYPSFKTAMALLEENLKENVRDRGDALADQLAKTLLLSTRINHRKEAIEGFEEMDRQQALSAEHRFSLARLYDAAGNWPKAKVQMLTLLGSLKGKEARYYAYYARAALKHDELAQAELWLANLKRDFPNSLATLEIMARVLKAQGKDDDAVQKLKALGENKAVDAGRLAALVDDLVGADFKSAATKSHAGYRSLAEQLYRAKIGQAPDRAALLAFAAFLARNNRLAEALDRCEQALAKGPPEAPLEHAVAALRANGADEKSVKRVEAWLNDKLNAPGTRSTQMLLTLADLRDLQGQYGVAANLYRKVLQKNPREIVALNNLAWIVAHQDRTAEALELMDNAIAAAGPLPELLDTKGVIYLIKNDSKAAIKALEESIRSVQAPSYYFHLACAQLQDKSPGAADISFKTAQKKGFTANDVHPLDRPQYQQLLEGLNRKKTAQERATR